MSKVIKGNEDDTGEDIITDEANAATEEAEKASEAASETVATVEAEVIDKPEDESEPDTVTDEPDTVTDEVEAEIETAVRKPTLAEMNKSARKSRANLVKKEAEK